MDHAYMQSPDGDEIRQVEGTAAALTPLMAQGWHQVPAPPGKTAILPPAKPEIEEKQ